MSLKGHEETHALQQTTGTGPLYFIQDDPRFMVPPPQGGGYRNYLPQSEI